MRGALLVENGGGDALIASGCLRAQTTVLSNYVPGSKSAPVFIITDFGKLLLRVLRGYCRAREVPFIVPGREHLEGERSRKQGIEEFPIVDQLRQVLFTLVAVRAPAACGYQPPSWSMGDASTGRGSQPPSATGRARLSISELSSDEADRVRALAPAAPEVMHGMPTNEIGVGFTRIDGTDKWRVWVDGPHDILRHLADDLDVRWA
jgi:hypothetical protein